MQNSQTRTIMHNYNKFHTNFYKMLVIVECDIYLYCIVKF